MIKEKSFNICLHSEILVASHKEKVIVINNIRNLQIASFMSTRSMFLLVYINKVHLFSQFSFILKDKENSEQNQGIHNHYNICRARLFTADVNYSLRLAWRTCEEYFHMRT